MMTVFAGCLLAGCVGNGNERTARVDGLEMDSVVVDTTISLGSRSDAPRCHVRLSVQYAKGDGSRKMNDAVLRSGLLVPDYFGIGGELPEMKQAVDSFVGRYLSDYRREFGEFYRHDPQYASSYNNEYVVSTHTENGRDDVVTYWAHTYLYSGGAHGVRQTIVKNINMKSGQVLRLSDVLEEGYEIRLTELLTEKLCEHFGVKTTDELHEKNVLVGMDVYAPDNFVLGKKSTIFIYVEDEIAPHDEGEIKIEIPNSELSFR